ncbi:transmembrane protein 256 homolog [Eurytemora carolleeae]|uniref:transmembrane protein 256 homolog n=1 Tax=Eurytemora carolleeae TaxID=1294199 RepID=UPI000C772035|nr:transmembrane protein 256 homolog [Eurytemora carolleeae]|eukprot:XP_023346477.1 transmembrane protein 256 homolog [Eurytemora affinis]
MNSAFESIYTVWDWSKKSGGQVLNNWIHPSCGSRDIGVQTQIQGLSKEVISTTVAEMPVSSFVRIAGLSGALAVSLGAYGAHVLSVDPDNAKLRATFDTANKYHLVHSVALLAVPLARVPRLSGSLFLSGMVVFCGTTYYHALTQDTTVRQYTPYGGVLLILAWLSLIL